MILSLTPLARRTAAAFLTLTLAGSAFAFADDDARRAILELRETVKQMQSDIDSVRSGQLQLANEITSLREQNRQLTGRVEELTNQLAVEKRNSRTLYESVDKRLGVFEPQMVVIDGQSVQVQADEKNAYDAAVQLLQEGKFLDAEKAFKEFSTRWDKSPYRPDAIFWWGTSAFTAEHYKTAISTQNQLLREYPKSSRAPDAMMLVASSQAASGSVTAARNTLNKIIRTYPNTEVAKEAGQRLKDLGQKK